MIKWRLPHGDAIELDDELDVSDCDSFFLDDRIGEDESDIDCCCCFGAFDEAMTRREDGEVKRFRAQWRDRHCIEKITTIPMVQESHFPFQQVRPVTFLLLGSSSPTIQLARRRQGGI